MRDALRAFRHRNFRLFFAGQGTSQIGTWLQLIAVSWLVHRLSDSAFMLGLAAFALQFPFLVLAPFAGVMVDRYDKRRVLLVTNSIASGQSLVLLALVATGRIEVWHLIAGNAVLGIVNAFDAPARQALLVRLVERREELPNAIAFNSTMMNGARFIGPMVGGTVIAAFGETWGFALNSLSYVAMLTSLSRMRLAHAVPPREAGSLLTRLAAGLRFAYGFLPTRAALLLLAATSFCVAPYQSLMPWFVEHVHGGDPETLGALLGAGGGGAVSAMLYLATRTTVRGLLRLMAAAGVTASLGLIGFAGSSNFWLALAFVYCVGAGLMMIAASTNTVLQTIVPDALRARVASLYVMAFLGAAPFGSLAAGWIGDTTDPRLALAIGGLLGLVATATYVRKLPAIRRDIDPVYEKLGIAPRTPQ